MDFINLLLNINVLLHLLGIASITYLVRTIVEYFIPSVVSKNFYKNLALPIFPIIVSIAFFNVLPIALPFDITQTPARVLYSLTIGLLSSQTYRMIRAQIKAKFPSSDLPDIPDLSIQDLERLHEETNPSPKSTNPTLPDPPTKNPT